MNRTLTIFNILKGMDLKGGFVYTYSRKPNATTLDVVVTDEAIHIHALNVKDGTQPNLQDFKYALDKIKERLGFLDDKGVIYISISQAKRQLKISRYKLEKLIDEGQFEVLPNTNSNTIYYDRSF